METTTHPNIVYVFADQWRAQAVGYAGDPNLRGKTPNMDRLAGESINFSNAVSCCPVCTPYRASLLTGQYPVTHGLFINDLCLGDKAVSLAQACTRAGYDTAYIGKWHIDGNGRGAYIPPERRQGFDYWKGNECTHDYHNSRYYAGNDPTPRYWDGYDAIAQTRDAQRYIEQHAGGEKPFLLVLSWGPPHDPCDSAPEQYKAMFHAGDIVLRPNVSADMAEKEKEELAGYYAHIAALDDGVGALMKSLDRAGIAGNTILVVTSDHGDMFGAQGFDRKIVPWDESIRVPFLLRYPAAHGSEGREVRFPINTPDIMPTLLGLGGIAIPDTVEGTDYSGVIRGGKGPEDRAALIMCVAPFDRWARPVGSEYRGVRTRRYTYVRDARGPWLLYDNGTDPYQRANLVGLPRYRALQGEMEAALRKELEAIGDEFLPAEKYIEKWKHNVDETFTVPYWEKEPRS